MRRVFVSSHGFAWAQPTRLNVSYQFDKHQAAGGVDSEGNRLAQSLSKIPRFHVHDQDVCDDSSVFVQHETIP